MKKKDLDNIQRLMKDGVLFGYELDYINHELIDVSSYGADSVDLCISDNQNIYNVVSHIVFEKTIDKDQLSEIREYAEDIVEHTILNEIRAADKITINNLQVLECRHFIFICFDILAYITDEPYEQYYDAREDDF